MRALFILFLVIASSLAVTFPMTGVLGQPLSQLQEHQHVSILSMTGQQFFANGTALAYFNDGSISKFEHEMTPENGYYYDNTTIFYFGEVPGISSADNIKCGENATINNNTTTEVIEAIIISGANVIENKSRAIQPSSVITINAGDTVTWINQDFTSHGVSFPPRGLMITGGIPSEEIFHTRLQNQEGFSCTFTEPGGFHYDIDNANNGIVGTVIVEPRE